LQEPQVSRLGPALRWLAPSAAAGCAGGVVAGLVEGGGAGGAGMLAAAGFVALLAVPVLATAGAIARGLAAAWRPAELAAVLVDGDGAAPRLAGWVAVIWLGSLALGAAMFQSVWALSIHTAFKPLVLGFAQPAIAVAAVGVLVALSRPGARLFAWIAQRIDARWRRGGRRTLLRPPIIFATAGLTALAVAWVLWRITMPYRLGSLDAGVLYGPAAGVAAAIAMHVVWRRLRWRRLVGAACGLAAAAVIATAIAALARPAMVLELGRGRPLAGLAIDWLLDADAMRAPTAPSR
jgi:hypothetical protein